MNRRQFLFTSFASGTGLVMPNVVTAAVKKYTRPRPRPPLIVHTVVIRPHSNHFDTGAILKVKKSKGKHDLIHQGTALGIGDLLSIRLISVDMGHHLIGLYVGDNEIRQFRSWIVGGMLERGEPLTATITDKSKDSAFRIDIILNRPLKPGERLPLIDPVSEKLGKSAQMVRRGNNEYRLPNGEWNPVHALPWYKYCPSQYTKKPKLSKNGFRYYLEDLTITNDLVPINPRRRNVWHPTPWNDLRPAVPILTQNGADLAYITPGFDHSVEQLLLRGENVEAKMIKPGKYLPREIMVNFSLVC
jgi:hypothetical protein